MVGCVSTHARGITLIKVRRFSPHHWSVVCKAIPLTLTHTVTLLKAICHVETGVKKISTHSEFKLTVSWVMVYHLELASAAFSISTLSLWITLNLCTANSKSHSQLKWAIKSAFHLLAFWIIVWQKTIRRWLLEGKATCFCFKLYSQLIVISGEKTLPASSHVLIVILCFMWPNTVLLIFFSLFFSILFVTF